MKDTHNLTERLIELLKQNEKNKAIEYYKRNVPNASDWEARQYISKLSKKIDNPERKHVKYSIGYFILLIVTLILYFVNKYYSLNNDITFIDWIISILFIISIFGILSNINERFNIKQKKENLKEFERKNQLEKERIRNGEPSTREKDIAESEEKQRINSYIDRGFYHLNIAIKGLYYRDFYSQERAKTLKINEEVYLSKENDNPKDKYAVRVVTKDSFFIGYVDRLFSEDISNVIKKGIEIYCFVSKVTSDYIPYVYMNVYYDIKSYSKSKDEINRVVNKNNKTNKNHSKEDPSFIDEIYNIDPNNSDFEFINIIRAEDDDAILDLQTKFLFGKILCNEDIVDWYNDIVLNREYKIKYLKKRVKEIAKKEGYKF